MSYSQKSEMVTIKVIGSETAIERMLEVMRQTFLFTSRGIVLENDRDKKNFTFVEVNP